MRDCPSCGIHLKPFQVRVGVKPFPCIGCGKDLRVSLGYFWLHILVSWILALGILNFFRAPAWVAILLMFPLSLIISFPLPLLLLRIFPPRLQVAPAEKAAWNEGPPTLFPKG